MNKRVGFKRVLPQYMLDNIENNKCPPCGNPKEEWNRRTDWRCCSVECTQEFIKTTTYSWGQTKAEAMIRDDYKCVKCSTNYKESELVGDHIVPIAIGGKEFDLKNVQTLCVPCHKEKTKLDMKTIAKLRNVGKLIDKGQTKLWDGNEKCLEK